MTPLSQPIKMAAQHASRVRPRCVTAVASPTHHRSALWPEAAIVTVLMLIALAGSLWRMHQLGPAIVEIRTEDVWFEADIRDFFPMLSERWSPRHGETNVHPLFSLMVCAPVIAIQKLLGLSPLHAVHGALAVVAALWVAGLYGILRAAGCRRMDAALFSILALNSAAVVFGFVVPESFPFGSLTIVLALGLVALSARRRIAPAWYVLMSAATLSITITNWMTGILATFERFPWRRALQLTVNAFCLVVVLSAAQRVLFPHASYMLDGVRKGRFIFDPDAGGPRQIVKAVLFHSMVMPAIADRPDPKHRLQMVTQSSPPGSGTPWGRAAVWLWAALLGVGVWGARAAARHLALRNVVCATLLGQLALHLVYGDEMLLYAPHIIPLLIVLAAFGTLTRARPLVLVLAVALVVCVTINNGLQFRQAAALVHRYAAALQGVVR